MSLFSFKDLLNRLAALPREVRFLAVVSVALCILVLPYHRPDLGDPAVADFSRGYEGRLYADTSNTLTLGQGWRVDGDVFKAAEAGEVLRIQLPVEIWRRVDVRLIAPPETLWAVRVGRGHQNHILPNVAPGDELRFEGDMIPGDPASGLPLIVGVTPASVPASGEATLRRINVMASPREHDERPENLVSILLFPFLPASLALFLLFSGRRSLRMSAGIGAALALAGAIGIRMQPSYLDFVAPAVGATLLASAAGAALKWLRRDEAVVSYLTPARIEALAVAGLLALALTVRWDALVRNWGVPLLPDARGYLQIAQEGTFYSTLQTHAPWIREPLFPALLRGWLWLVPDTVNGARALGLVLGLLPPVLAWLVGRRLFSPLVGVLAGMWMAANPYLAGISVMVLRDDLLTALVLGLLAVEVLAGERRWVRSVGFGLLAGALALTRINFLFLAPMFLIGMVVRRRWGVGEIVLGLVLMVAPVIPHLQFNASVAEGDWLYSSNVHLRYYANRDHIGEAGFPATFAEWNADPYAGGVMTGGQFFGLYTAGELVWRTFRGLVMIFVFEYPHAMLFEGNEIVMAFGLLGVWGWWRYRRTAWVAIPWYLWVMAPVALIATITLDYRLASPATPIIVWTWALGVELAVQQFLKAVGIRASNEAQ